MSTKTDTKMAEQIYGKPTKTPPKEVGSYVVWRQNSFEVAEVDSIPQSITLPVTEKLVVKFIGEESEHPVDDCDVESWYPIPVKFPPSPKLN